MTIEPGSIVTIVAFDDVPEHQFLVDEVFEDFEREPMAAASLGQVHRARLDGQEVVVKVLRPGVEETVALDLDDEVVHHLRQQVEQLRRVEVGGEIEAQFVLGHGHSPKVMR